MNRTGKRLFGLFMAFIMTLTIIPTAALAEEPGGATEAGPGWSLNTDASASNEYYYVNTSGDRYEMKNNKLPDDLTDLITACATAEPATYADLKAVAEAAKTDGTISEELFAYLCPEANADGSVTYHANKGVDVTFQANGDGTFEAVLLDSEDTSVPKNHWSGNCQAWMLFREVTTEVSFDENITFTSVPAGGIFAKFTALREVNWPMANENGEEVCKIKTVSNNAFMTTALATDGKLTLPEGIAKVEGYAFTNFDGDGSTITKVYLPKSMETVNEYAFHRTAGNVTLYGYFADKGEAVKALGYNYVDLTNYSDGNIDDSGITYEVASGKLILGGEGVIPDYEAGKAPWFTGDAPQTITEVVIGSGITGIGSNAFNDGEHEIACLAVPKTVTNVSENGLAGVKKAYLLNTDLNESADTYGAGESVTYDAVAKFNEAANITAGDDLWIGIKGNTAYVEGNGTISCSKWNGDRGFSEEFEAKLQTVTNVVFSESYNGGNGITSLGGGIFAGLPIKEVDFSGVDETLKTMANNVFMSTDIQNIVLPKALTSIGSYCFGWYPNPYTGHTGETPESVTFPNASGITYTVGTTSTHNVFTYESGTHTPATILFVGPIGADGKSDAKSYAREVGAVYHTDSTVADANYGTTGDISWLLVDISENCDNTEFELVISGTGAVNAPEDGKAWNADTYKEKITAITIDDGITSIGEQAFYGMTALTGTVILPVSVESVGSKAFALADGTTDGKELAFRIGNANCNIADDARANRTDSTSDTQIVASGNYGPYIDGTGNVTEDNIGTPQYQDNVTYSIYANGTDTYTMELAGSGTTAGFSYNGSLHDATHPNCMPAEVLEYRGKVTKLVIGEGITSLGYAAFAYFDAVEEVTFPTTLKTISSNAFIAALTDNAKTTTVSDAASDAGIAFEIPATVTSINNYFGLFNGTGAAFDQLYFANPDIKIQDSDLVFGSYANTLTLVVSANGEDNNVKTHALKYGIKYKDLTDPNNIDATTIDGITYSMSGGILIIEPADGATGELTIPTKVLEKLGTENGTTYTAAQVTNIVIKSGIKKIEDEAFSGYTGLTSVDLPNGITAIGDKAFGVAAGAETEDLTITIPKAATLGDNIFENRASDKVTVTVYAESQNSKLKGEGLTPTFVDTLKVLLIGNSYSEDATNCAPMSTSRLYTMLKNAYPDKEITLGLCYSGGKTMAWHYDKALNNSPSYSLRVIDDGHTNWYTASSSITSANALEWTDWDVVSLQPYSTETRTGTGSNYAGETPYSYPLTTTIPYMMNLVSTHAPAAKQYLYMTWNETNDAAQLNAGYAGYQQVVGQLLNKTYTSGSTTLTVVPVGTAIQNERNTYLGLIQHNVDAITANNVNLTTDPVRGLQRDGGHLSYNVGRYTAALTFAAMITAPDGTETKDELLARLEVLIAGIPLNYEGTIELPADYMSILKTSVANAILTPDDVTDVGTADDVDPAEQAKTAIEATAFSVQQSGNTAPTNAYVQTYLSGAIDITTLKETYPEISIGAITVTGVTGATSSADGSFTATVPVTFGYATTTATITGNIKYVSGSNPSNSGSGSSSSSSGYAVTVDSGKNGTVSVSPKSASKGTTVTITVKPNSGYELDSLTVTDKDGKAVKVTEGKNGKYTFTMPASKVTVEATFAEIEEHRFVDVPSGYWAEDEITWAYENGYMNGNTATTFNPNGTVTRQQLWMILARLSGYQPADFAEAKAWAVDNGISDGTVPGNAVSRQQLVTILYRYAARMGYKTTGAVDLTAFPDHASVAAYATDAMAWSVANNIVGGTTQGTLNPTGTATRAQFAVILYRFCENIVK